MAALVRLKLHRGGASPASQSLAAKHHLENAQVKILGYDTGADGTVVFRVDEQMFETARRALERAGFELASGTWFGP